MRPLDVQQEIRITLIQCISVGLGPIFFSTLLDFILGCLRQ